MSGKTIEEKLFEAIKEIRSAYSSVDASKDYGANPVLTTEHGTVTISDNGAVIFRDNGVVKAVGYSAGAACPACKGTGRI